MKLVSLVSARGVVPADQPDRLPAHVQFLGPRLPQLGQGALPVGLGPGFHGRQHVPQVGLLFGVQAAEVGLQLLVSRGLRPGLDPGGLHGIEEQRRGDELVEDEDHGPDEEDEELHRHLDHGVDQQAQAALGDRAAGQVALDLGLVASRNRTGPGTRPR